jgi:hypothetical protein
MIVIWFALGFGGLWLWFRFHEHAIIKGWLDNKFVATCVQLPLGAVILTSIIYLVCVVLAVTLYPSMRSNDMPPWLTTALFGASLGVCAETAYCIFSKWRSQDEELAAVKEYKAALEEERRR